MNERPFEYSFVFDMIAQKKPCTLLDVGTGQTSFPHLVNTCDVAAVGIDPDKKQIKKNTAYQPVLDDILAPKIKGQFDMVTCISVLEHVESYELAVKNMAALLAPKGWLVMTFPFDEKYRVVYKTRKAFCQAFSQELLDAWIENYSLNGPIHFKVTQWKDCDVVGVCLECAS